MRNKLKNGSIAVLLLLLVVSAAVFGAALFYRGGFSVGVEDANNQQRMYKLQKIATSSAKPLSETDTVSAIEDDLSGTDISPIDKELSSFDASFK